ncbi:Neuroglian [Strongyloides ratti]|uniref:Neuroglian n=1 Tax=Strongyloides ratti TaxID=34506 RepID=A0A090N0N1_STRRB|nr:Neuroglian [Strongyloides ratti]CEF70978.1 Neuroglian [Strongyloides ratti]
MSAFSSSIEYNLYEIEGKHIFDNELIVSCENVQKNMFILIEKLENCIFVIIDNKYNFMDIKNNFQEDILNLMYKIDEDVHVICDKVRIAIDTCNVKDDRLNFLLTIHKYQQAISIIIKELSECIGEAIEKTLDLRIRGICNITIEKNVIVRMAHLRKEIVKPIMSFGPRTRNLNCFTSPYSFIYPKWYHNDKLIVNNKNGYWFENNRKSLFFNVTENKGGKYNCNSDVQSSINRTFYVNIEGPPKWIYKPPIDTNASEGETVTFYCNTTGKPNPKTTFYKNGVKMNNSKNKYLIKNNKLTLINVTYGIYGTGDNSIYQCKAENKHGYLWNNFYLKIIEFKPELIKKSDDIEVIEGDDVVIFCEFSSMPSANITWKGFKNVAYEVIKTVKKNKEKIKLKYVDKNSEGEYICKGSNKYGFDEGIIKVIIRNKTKFINENDTSIIHLAGNNLKLSCKVIHDDSFTLKYEWLIDNNHINTEKFDYNIINNDTVLLKNVNSLKSVKCKVSTKLNFIEKNFKITVVDVPNPVEMAFVVECNQDKRFAKINFKHSEKAYLYSPVMEFWIQYLIDSYDDSTSWITYPIPINAENYEYIYNDTRIVSASTIINLKPYCHYQFRIFARNFIGDSTPKLANEICTTSPNFPYLHPTNVRIEIMNFNSIKVYWNIIQREHWNGPNFRYEIHYKPSSNNTWDIKKIDNPFQNNDHIIFDENIPFEMVDVKVLSVNDIGMGIEVPNIVQGRTGLLLIDNSNIPSIYSDRTTRRIKKLFNENRLEDYPFFIVIIFIIIILFQICLFITCLCKKKTTNNKETLDVKESLIQNFENK